MTNTFVTPLHMQKIKASIHSYSKTELLSFIHNVSTVKQKQHAWGKLLLQTSRVNTVHNPQFKLLSQELNF